MKVKLNQLMAGPDGVFHPGAEIDLPTVEAKRLEAEGVVEIVGKSAPKPKAEAKG